MSGEGQVVDAAIVDGTAHLNAMTSAFLASGGYREERGANLLDGGVPFYDVYETSDGKHMSVGRARAAVLRHAARHARPRGAPRRARPTSTGTTSCATLLTDTFKQRTQAEWVELFEGTDACVAGVIPISEAPEHPHLKARQTFVEHEGLVQPQPAPRFSRTDGDAVPAALAGRRHAHPGGAHRVGRRATSTGSSSEAWRSRSRSVKPFLFLGIRAQDAAADDEYAAVLRCAGLDERDVRRVRLEREELGPLDLDDWSGIVVGGGPWNVSDPEESKAPEQRRGEARLRELALQVVDADFPFLGACYGVGTLGTLGGGVVDRQWSEPIGAVTITLTRRGRRPTRCSAGCRQSFDAFLGHKEAVSTLPRGAVLLASSPTCPVQAFRIGQHVYATQFHPELDVESIIMRIETYRDFGYFEPDEGDELIRLARAAVVTEPPRILARFVELYAR